MRPDPKEEPVVRPKVLPLLPRTTDLVPVRMVNEYAYCPRLFYLVWVQSEWDDNHFTRDGKYVHRRVDAGSGKKLLDIESSTEDALPYVARSVALSSEALRVTGKLDVVEVEGKRVSVVEYKRGTTLSVPEGAYLPERIQLALQVLLLEEHGYEVASAEIYYAASKTRVVIDISPELRQIAIESVSKALELSAASEIPPPLVDSKKCNGCSLVGICLPDEVNFLKSIEEQIPANDIAQPRRLVPARDFRKPLYIQEQGARLGKSGELLVVTRRDASKEEIRLHDTSHVGIYGNISVSAQVMTLLMSEGVPVHFLTYGGWLKGRAVGYETHNAQNRRAQYAFSADTTNSLSLSCAIIESKILNCRTILRRNAKGISKVILKDLKELAHKAREADSKERLLGIEGAAARTYFQNFATTFKLLDEDISHFDFNGRNRRPPKDPVNALLSFAYSMLVRHVTEAIHVSGLDPMIGIYHSDGFGRPSLALDLIHEFRPLIADSAVITALNNGSIAFSDFVYSAGACSLKPEARKSFIMTFERRLDQLISHPLFDYPISYQRVLEVQSRILTRIFTGELSHYPKFLVR